MSDTTIDQQRIDLFVRCQNLEGENDRLRDLLQQIADALGTGEQGKDLVEVARHAHTAEYSVARLEALLNSCHEFIEPFSDVKDGDEGRPEANSAMSLCMEIERLVTV